MIVPSDCRTCRYRRQVEYGPALAVGIIEQRCSKFGRYDRFGNYMRLTCATAHDEFCGGGDYEPDLLRRFTRLFVNK